MSKGNKKRRKALGLLPTHEKCKARNRFGEPCKKYPIEGSTVCASHGGAAPQVRRKAQERIMMAQDDAASLLVNAMADERIPFAERRRAAEYLLNFESRHQNAVTVAPWFDNIASLLIDVADDDSAPAVVTGELVPGEDDTWSVTALPSVMDDPPRYSRSGPRLR